MLTNPNTRLNSEEIEAIREGGKIWQLIKNELVFFVKPGVTGKEINDEAKRLFDKYNVETAFYMYENFPGHICVSVNDCIIHGVGNDIPLNPEDKITLDIGFKHRGVYIDSATTLIVDPLSNPDYAKFIEKCRKALWAGIKAVKPNCYNGDIAFAIESFVRSFNDREYSLINGYVGHTIGREIHQHPRIFNKGLKKGQGDKLSPNTVICIEPMLLKQNTGEFIKGSNGFDIFSKKKGAFTCHWEHMVLIKNDGIEVLTASEEEIKENLG